MLKVVDVEEQVVYLKWPANGYLISENFCI